MIKWYKLRLVHQHFAAINVCCNTRNKASPTPRAVLREPGLNTYKKSCKCLCTSEDKEDKPQHPDTLKPPVLYSNQI